MNPLCMITNFVNCKRVFHKVFDIIVALSDQIVICQWTFKNLFQDINTFRTKSITLNGLRARDVNINPYWQIMENSSGNFTEIFIFRVVTQAVLLENSSIHFFDWNHIWYVTFGLDEFSIKTACVTPQNCPIDDWMNFPVKGSRWRPGFFKNWIGTQDFLMDEFSSKTASEMSQKFADKG